MAAQFQPIKEGLYGQDIKLNLVTSMLKRLKAYKMTKRHLEACHGKTTKWYKKIAKRIRMVL